MLIMTHGKSFTMLTAQNDECVFILSGQCSLEETICQARVMQVRGDWLRVGIWTDVVNGSHKVAIPWRWRVSSGDVCRLQSLGVLTDNNHVLVAFIFLRVFQRRRLH